MRITYMALASSLMLAASFTPAGAATPMFATEAAAAQACGADEIVWIDLDRGKFYHKAQANFAKSSNGGYACAKAAHSQYRESHD